MKIKLVESKADYKSWRKWAIILGIFFLISIASIIITGNSILAPKTELTFCDKIEGTPAWAKEGKIIGYGYMEDLNVLPDGVFFYYRPGCYWCQKQIKNFGEQYFSELKEEGYAIDCTK